MPRCHTPSLMKIDPSVPVKKIFEGFYHIWAWRPSWSCDQYHINKFHFHVPLSSHTNLVKDGPVVSEKSMFLFSYVKAKVKK